MKKQVHLLLLLALSVFSSAAWAGILPNYGGGSGTEANPFLIKTKEHLVALSLTPEQWGSDFYFKQIADIELTPMQDREVGKLESLTPIGLGNNPFAAHFDGSGYSISNLTICAAVEEDGSLPSDLYTTTNFASFGLFTNTKGAEIKNVNLTNVEILLDNSDATNTCIGGLIGKDLGGSTIENCSVSGRVNGYDCIGGLIGRSEGTTTSISNSIVKASGIHGTMGIGGLVGYADDIKITTSCVIGKSIEHTAISGHSKIGGLIGVAQKATIKNAYAKADMNISEVQHLDDVFVGGFAGSLVSGTVTNCYSSGSVTTEDDTEVSHIGGFVGSNNAMLTACFFNSTEAPEGESTTAIALVEGEMEKMSHFVYEGWDFNTIWRVGEDGMPSLNNPYANCLPGGTPLEYLWVGLDSDKQDLSQWNDAEAWFGGAVPSTTSDVYIPASAFVGTSCVIKSTDAICSSLTIAKAGELTIESDANYYGQLLVEKESLGEVTYKLFVPEAISATPYAYNTDWHYFASPVFGQDINAFANDPSNHIAIYAQEYALGILSQGTGDYENYNRPVVNYVVQGDDSHGDFLPGIGYTFLQNQSSFVTFKGEVATTSVAVKSHAPTNIDHPERWAFLGNPFTSALNGEVLFEKSEQSLCELCRAFYIYDNAQKTYIAYNYAEKVPTLSPGQGFHIHVPEGGNTITFDADMRTNAKEAIFKSTATQSDYIKLEVNSPASENISICSVYFSEDKTDGFDSGYDAPIYQFTSTDILSLSSELVDNSGVTSHTDASSTFQVQTLGSDRVYEASIPLALQAKASAEVTLSLSDFKLPSDVALYIEDKTTGIETEISEDASYSFTTSATPAKDADRFVLHLKSVTSSNPLSEAGITVVAQPNQGTLLVQGDVVAGTVLSVYSITGQVIKTVTLDGGMSSYAAVGTMKPGIYVVSLSSDSGKYTQKIKW